MKLKGKRIGCMLLAAGLLACTLHGSAAGVAGSVSRQAPENGSVSQLAPEDGYVSEMFVVDSADAVERMAAGGTTGYDGADLYSQLNTRQKACFDAIAGLSIDQILAGSTVTDSGSGRRYRQITLQVAGVNDTTLSGSFRDGRFYSDSSSKSAEAGIYTDICAAIIALRYDRPDIFWTNYLRYGYRVNQIGASTAKVTGVKVDFWLEFDGEEKAQQALALANARSIADRAMASGSDAYTRLLTAHDLLCEGNTYGDAKKNASHTAYSALVFDDAVAPVCDGYAKAFKIVCDYMGIPCVTASSSDHMWNNVRMDNGKWYNVDLTFDDSGDRTSHDYFLIGSQTQINGAAFASQANYREVNPYQATYQGDTTGSLRPVTFRFPTKSAEKYSGDEPDEPDPPTPSTGFADVTADDWFYNSVNQACEQGLFYGDSDGLFWPNRAISRAEFASVLARVMKMSDDVHNFHGYADYPDVHPDAWYADVVSWITALGYMSGDEYGFRPEDPITREEMCAVLNRTMGYPAESTSFKFKDDAKISGWARNSVYLCYTLGIVSGDEYGFRPQDNTPRCEAASVFIRYARTMGYSD